MTDFLCPDCGHPAEAHEDPRGTHTRAPDGSCMSTKGKFGGSCLCVKSVRSIYLHHLTRLTREVEAMRWAGAYLTAQDVEYLAGEILRTSRDKQFHQRILATHAALVMLTREVAEERARLDWMEANLDTFALCRYDGNASVVTDYRDFDAPTLREAIDKARTPTPTEGN